MELLPVHYVGLKSAWMTAQLFHEWFHHSFVPYVRAKLISLGLVPKAILVLDNCPTHPSVEELVSNDGKISQCYLPHPTHGSGCSRIFEASVQEKLLHRLLIEEESGTPVINVLKTVDLKVVVDLATEAWDEISPVTLRKSWQEILSLSSLASADQPSGDKEGSETSLIVNVVKMAQFLTSLARLTHWAFNSVRQISQHGLMVTV